MKLNQIIVEIEDLERTLIKIRVRSGKPDDVNKAENEAEVSLSLVLYCCTVCLVVCFERLKYFVSFGTFDFGRMIMIIIIFH